MAKKSSKKRKFKGAVSRNAQKQQRGASYGHLNLPKGISVFKEDPGSRVNLDILPYEVTCDNHPDRDEEYEIAVAGSLWYKRPYWLHRNIGADNQSIVCPSSIGQKCPICEYRAQLMKEGVEWNDDSVKALKPSMRNLYIVVPKGSKKHDETPHVWDISQFLFQDKLNEEIGENEEYETFPDLEEGLTLRIRFSEESFGNNKFADTSRIDFIERKGVAYDDSILEEVPSLDEILHVFSSKAVEALFFGGADINETEEEEEDEKPKRKPSSKTKKKQEAEDEDDDDDEIEDEDEVEEDEVEEDEVEEDDDEVEEEEEEKPEPKKPTRKSNTKSTKEKKEEKKPTKSTKKSKCPHGYKFGKDCEEYDECDNCEQWEACMDASEGR